MTKPNSRGNGYWQGQTDSKLEALSTSLTEVKMTLMRVEEKLDSVRLWRAKVMGLGGAAGAVGATLVKLIWGHW